MFVGVDFELNQTRTGTKIIKFVLGFKTKTWDGWDPKRIGTCNKLTKNQGKFEVSKLKYLQRHELMTGLCVLENYPAGIVLKSLIWVNPILQKWHYFIAR